MKRRLLIRIDDVCPTMDYSKFMERITFLGKFGIKPLLGVIPDCEDETLQYGEISNFWDIIRDFAHAGYPIAMHGYKHRYTTSKRGLVCFRKLSEFSGIPYEDQLAMLQKGKRILEENEIYTEWFMAPGHSYDYKTIRALYTAGFRYVSDGRSGLPYELHGVTFIPASSIWQSPFNGKIVTVCLHPNTDSKYKYQKVQSFIEQNLSNISSFSDVKAWKKRPYWLCRIEEIFRMSAEKIALRAYSAVK